MDPLHPAAEIAAHMVAIHRMAGLATRRRAPARQPWPRSIEQDYGTALVGIVNRARCSFEPVLREMPRLLARLALRSDSDRSDGSDLDAAKMLVDRSADAMDADLNDLDLEELASRYGNQMDRRQREDLSKQLALLLGISILLNNRGVPDVLEGFAHENATLVRAIPRQLHDDVAALTARAITSRMPPERFLEIVEQKFGSAETRARFIARNQLGDLNGRLNRTRQEAIGVESYTWATMRDPVVRSTHRPREGRSFRWDEPPAEEPYDGHPGEPPGCRCSATPDVSHILAHANRLGVMSRFSSTIRH